MDINNKIVFTVSEVAEIMNVKPDIIVDLVDAGYIRAIKIRSSRITKVALLEFLEKYDGVDLGKELYSY